MFRVCHGLQSVSDAPTKEVALSIVDGMLSAGLVNILITRGDVEITGSNSWDSKPDGTVGRIILEIPVK